MQAHDTAVELGFQAIRDWIVAGREGSADAQGKLFARCRDYLLLMAQHELDPDLRAKLGASDLVQETFLNAQRGFAHFRGQSEDDLMAWLRQILRNHACEAVRRYRRAAKRDVSREYPLASLAEYALEQHLAEETETPSRQFAAAEEAESLDAALARLPEHYRRVIQWRNADRRSFEEIGALLDRSAEAARKLWVRAIDQLRVEMGIEDVPVPDR